MHTNVVTGRDIGGSSAFLFPRLTFRPRLSSYRLGFVALWVCREWRNGRGSLLQGQVCKVLKLPQLTRSFKSAAMGETSGYAHALCVAPPSFRSCCSGESKCSWKQNNIAEKYFYLKTLKVPYSISSIVYNTK